MTATRSPFLAAFALPLALALSACGSDVEETGSLEGEPIAEVPAPEGQQWSDLVTVSESDGYVLGNPDAPIKVLEYASLTCPACAAFAQDGADQLKEDYVNTGRVSFELRNQIHGPHDLMLAQLVRCGADETYHPLSDQVWKNLETVLGPVFERQEQFGRALELPEDQRFVAAAEVAGFYDFFAARGISEDQARSCLADFGAMTTIADNSTQQSNDLGVTGTPTFFINGQKQDGVSRWQDLEPLLQRAGAR